MLKKIKILIVITLILVLGIFSMWYFKIGIPCLYYELCGLYCPGCGMTRATYSLLQLDFYQAFRYNAFSIISIPLIALYVIGGVYAWLFNKHNFMDQKIPSVVWIIFIISLLLYGLLRNIPQFAFLAPTTI